jgi:hypothetical protein
MYIRLSDADRERLGCPERLQVKLADITAREQATLQHAFRYHDTIAIGEAITALFETGPDGKVRVRRDPELFLALTWIGLRRSAVFTGAGRAELAAELDGLDIQLNRVDIDADEEEEAAIEEAAEATEASEGKDSGSTPTRTSTG